jgi:hypothetical protein
LVKEESSLLVVVLSRFEPQALCQFFFAICASLTARKCAAILES